MSSQLITEMASYHKVLLPWLHRMTQRLCICANQCREEDQLRKELTFQNEMTYEVSY